ncbi:MAG: bile acid:sodium symporter family protein [Gammaproteobacteria bacterium]|nr:bile acid:sodium symporter family protein [Gammaproteobacteria bacterium]
MEIGQIYYDANSQWILNIVLASMILGVALDIQIKDFKAVAKMPKAIASGLVAQFIVLPAVTGLFTLYLDLPAGIELGMILVASCPGGAVSNFITDLSNGNTALSISMTAVASTVAIFMMPFNFILWAGINPDTSALMVAIDVSAESLLINLFLVLGIPLAIGMSLRHFMEVLANKLHTLLKYTSVAALISFIIIAIYRNHEAFFLHFSLIFSLVFAHNAIALFLGFMAGWILKLHLRDIKATTIEVGIQNSALALAIVFTQFNGEPGMALISAFWGSWHIISGLIIASIFRQWKTEINYSSMEKQA